jgi:tetratricopeptide (TPR) repeat protein
MTIAPLLLLLAAAAPPATLVMSFDPVEAAGAGGLGGSPPAQSEREFISRERYDWVGPAASELLARGLAIAGVPVADRGERLRAQAALELPQVSLTRATWLRIAEALGANRLVSGTYAVKDGQLTLSLRLLDAERASLSSPIVASGPLATLADLAHSLAWDVALASSTPPGMSREAFFARRPLASSDAVQAYGRSLAARRAATRLRLVRDALNLAPQFHEARLTLGQLLRDAGEFSAAYETLNRIPADAPESRAARFLQGAALLDVGRYRDAAVLYRAMADTEATPAILNNQALAVLRSPEDDGRASDLLRRAVDLAPAHADLLFNLGWVLLVEGDAEAAEFSMREAVRRSPLDPQARVVLAWALRRKGGTEAEDAWKAVEALAPTYQTLTRPDLTRHFERIMPAERLLDLDRGGRSETEVAAGLIGKAQRLFRTGDLAGALAELTRAAYLDPYATGVHTQLARVHRARGDRELALNELRMALWSHEDPALRAELAAVLKEAGRGAEARAEAERVLKADPANETARRVLQSP